MSAPEVMAVLFDVDGTLIDSNELHVEAWLETFHHFGVDAFEAKVRADLGKGGDQLAPDFVPGADLRDLHPKIEAFRADLYAREYLPRVKAFPGVRALFERLRADGRTIALASSGKSHEVDHAKEVANITDLVDDQTTADDVAHSKPSPDIFRAALTKAADVSAEQAVAIGDTPYDAQAARGTGVPTIGVLSGGFSEDVLVKAGCIAVYTDIQALLVGYDESPLRKR